MDELRVAILGAGSRGRGFARMLGEISGVRVVAVADPIVERRQAIAVGNGIPEALQYPCWRDFVAAGKSCDAVVVSTMDRDHVEPAVACMEAGYHLLLEKPMAVTLADCEAICAAQRVHDVVTSVCHSLRYHKGFAKLVELVNQ